MKKFFAIILLSSIAILILSGCTQQGTQNQTGNVVAVSDSIPNGQEHVIEITEEGYVPNKLEIKMGGAVKWVNRTSTPNWPASAKHPTHEVYPGSSITKCSTSEKDSIFDACSALGENESYSFTFNQKGTWFYHDHVNAKQFGQVIVE